MNLPDFPPDVPTATIPTIDFRKLADGAEEDSNSLFEAAQGYGFFYLKNHEVDDQSMFDLANGIFALPLEEKMRFDMGTTGRYFGYKSAGSQYVDTKGTRDTTEFYNISKDSILGEPSQHVFAHPALVQERQKDLAMYMQSCHRIVTVILQVLGEKLGLPKDLLPSLHKLNEASGDQVRLTQAAPVGSDAIALGQHTDFGSVTVLFNRLGGLQVLSSESNDFQYVRPQPGMAVINLGDAMVKLAGGRLCSGLHRVVGPPGEQGKCQRHSVVYFARPNGSVVLRSLFDNDPVEETTMTADEWIAHRVKGTLRAHFKGEQSFYENRGTAHIKNFFKPSPGRHQREPIAPV